MRLQLALNVRDIDEAVDYYRKLFNAAPHKRRAGYANFAIDEPPLKLVLFENPDAAERVNHLGVEVFDDARVREAGHRLEAAGILSEVEEETVCCHATQTKVWSDEPQGLRWEWYRVTDDTPDGEALIAPSATAPSVAACIDESETCCA
ncbi:MAG: glyoxalase/bleomycin resistance/extradiol dioxygenase family protein [Gemmatimonadales bacterium]|nr:glyoxalase/bleomycin resistance/extradiol dioxygenase family protein [Gemmatimonadales bacterium]MYG20570.1 glyoxalase/bleomycin resistance/extradiol dioxygenase family protein [Gemmatimonadales bacterium]MYL07055.1 glyoxalase/bleomycin resistance/extradiol dioxygenase family protein [Gemmatimonadales bacterium]